MALFPQDEDYQQHTWICVAICQDLFTNDFKNKGVNSLVTKMQMTKMLFLVTESEGS